MGRGRTANYSSSAGGVVGGRRGRGPSGGPGAESALRGGGDVVFRGRGSGPASWGSGLGGHFLPVPRAGHAPALRGGPGFRRLLQQRDLPGAPGQVSDPRGPHRFPGSPKNSRRGGVAPGAGGGGTKARARGRLCAARGPAGSAPPAPCAPSAGLSGSFTASLAGNTWGVAVVTPFFYTLGG